MSLKKKLLCGVATRDSISDDIQKAETNVVAFIHNVETDLITDAQAAWVWLQGELSALEPTVLADLKSAVSSAAKEAVSGTASAGGIVADTLTILARDGLDVLSKVKSDVITAVVGLTTVTPTPTAAAQPAQDANSA